MKGMGRRVRIFYFLLACVLTGPVFCESLAPLTPLAPQASLAELRFQNQLSISEEKAKDVMALQLGEPFDPEKIQAAADRLHQYYRNLYHPMAQVKWKALPFKSHDQFLLLVEVVEGPKGRLQELRFTGNVQVTSETLRTVVKTVPRDGAWHRLIRKDRLNLDALEMDRQALREFYHHLGYPDIEIGIPVLEKPADYQGFLLTWPILKEGKAYRIGTISFEAGKLPEASVLEELIPLEPGDPYNSRALRNIQVNFQKYLLGEGYAFATVDLMLSPREDMGYMDITFQVDMGRKPLLRKIKLHGNSQTSDHVILREIEIQPGEVFAGDSLYDTKTRIAQLPMFSQVELTYDGDLQSEFFDLNVRVQERKTGRFEVGVAYGETEEVAFLVNLLESNLSLKPPFKGDALSGRLSASIASSLFRVEGAIDNPRMGESHWGLNNRVSYEDNQIISDFYDQRSLHAQSILHYPLSAHQLLGVGLSGTFYDIYGMDPLLAESLSPEDQDVRLTSVLSYWDWNRTDHLLRPTSGGRLRAGVELGTSALGGNVDMVRTRLDAAYYLPTFFEQVLSLECGVENLTGFSSTERIPLPLRIYLGGQRNLRGFDYRSVSPAGPEGNLVGGEGAWWATLEYRIPTWYWLDLAVFLDVGDVSLDAYTFSGEGAVSDAGLGLIVRADNFPVRFDIASPLNTYDSDTVNTTGDLRLSFSAGYRFY